MHNLAVTDAGGHTGAARLEAHGKPIRQELAAEGLEALLNRTHFQSLN